MFKKNEGIIRLRFLVVLIVILSILYFLIYPQSIFKYKGGLESNYQTINHWSSFTSLESNQGWDILAATSSFTSTSFYLYNTSTGNASQLDLKGYLGISKISDNFIQFYDNKKTDDIYTILLKEGNEYQIVKFNEKMTYFDYEVTPLYTHPLYDSLFCQECIVKSKTNYKLTVCSHNNGIEVFWKKEEHLYEINLPADSIKSIFRGKSLNSVYKSKRFKNLLANINSKIPDDLTEMDFDRMSAISRRHSYYDGCYSENYKSTVKNFVAPVIIGQLDADTDGIDDLLIRFYGHRFINSKLICYSLEKKKVLWEKEYAPEIEDHHLIKDIDNDGLDEIILTMYSPSYEPSINKPDEEGSVSESRIYILDRNGETKIINGKKAIFCFSEAFVKPKILYLEKDNSLLFGFFSNYKKSLKNLYKWDLTQNNIEETDIEYSSLMYIGMQKNRIIVMDLFEGRFKEMFFDSNLNPKGKNERQLNFKIEHFTYNGVKLYGNYYHLVDSGLLNSDFIMVAQLPVGRIESDVLNYNSKIYFITKTNSRENFCVMDFDRNNELNPSFFVIVLINIVLLLFFTIVWQKLAFPYLRPNYSYFIIVSLANRFHVWNILGRLKDVYKLPMKISSKLEDAESVLREISSEYNLLISRKFLFFTQQIYEISNINEYLIMQRISHDLKNKLILLKLQVDEFESAQNDKGYKDNFEQLHLTIKELTHTTKNLTNLSKINTYSMQRLKISSLIKNLLDSHLSHPLYENIQLQYKVEDLITLGDAKLLQMALNNILANALAEIEIIDKIEIIISQNEKNKDIEIIIKNNLNHEIDNINHVILPGFSTKSNGTGLGTSITKLIMLKHQGDALFSIYDNKFISLLTLPSSQGKKLKKATKIII